MAIRPILRDDNGDILSRQRVKQVQRYLNWWRRKYLKDRTPLIVDGIPGKHTLDALGGVRWALGYGEDRNDSRHRHKWTRTTKRRMEHPHSRKYSSKRMLVTGAARRRAYRAHHTVNRAAASIAPGVTTFDGVPVRRAVVPHLQWAREHGWDGRVVSGWRSPLYSVSLCRRMCGRNSCPGRCAGLGSNHVRIAIDVSDYVEFKQLMARCPHRPRLYNYLRYDLVHFSPNGR